MAVWIWRILVATVDTVAADDNTTARWQHPYSGYFCTIGGRGNRSSISCNVLPPNHRTWCVESSVTSLKWTEYCQSTPTSRSLAGWPWGAAALLLAFSNTLNGRRTHKVHAKWRWWLLSWLTSTLSGQDQSAVSRWEDCLLLSLWVSTGVLRPRCHGCQLSMTTGLLKTLRHLLSAS